MIYLLDWNSWWKKEIARQALVERYAFHIYKDTLSYKPATTLFKKKSSKISFLNSVFYLCTSQPEENE